MTLLFESCDYVCSYEFEIQNNTENEVFISTTPLINNYSVVIDNYYVNSDNRVKYKEYSKRRWSSSFMGNIYRNKSKRSTFE